MQPKVYLTAARSKYRHVQQDRRDRNGRFYDINYVWGILKRLNLCNKYRVYDDYEYS